MPNYAIRFSFILIYIIAGSIFFDSGLFKTLFKLSIVCLIMFLFKVPLKILIKNNMYSILGILLFLAILFFKIENYNFNIILFCLNCFLVGLYEEVLFRHSLFRNIKSNNELIFSTLLVALIFAIAHIPNIRKYDLTSVLIQCYFAFLISIILTGLYVRFKSIILIASLHATINFIGTIDRVVTKEIKTISATKHKIVLIDYERLSDSIISITILLAPFSILALMYLMNKRKLKKQ